MCCLPGELKRANEVNGRGAACDVLPAWGLIGAAAGATDP